MYQKNIVSLRAILSLKISTFIYYAFSSLFFYRLGYHDLV